MDNNVITARKIRAYKGTKTGRLVPIGGFAADKVLTINNSERWFKNSDRPVVMVKVDGMPDVYVLKHSMNIKPVSPEFMKDSGERDEHQCAFTKEFKVPSFVLDYKTEAEFLNAEGMWDDELGFPDGGADSLLDDVYHNDDGGFLTVAQIAAMKPKERKAYRKALKLSKKQGKVQGTAAENAQTQALADAINAPDAASGVAGPAAPASGSGPSPLMIGGIGFSVVAVLMVLALALGGGKKAGVGAEGGGAPA